MTMKEPSPNPASCPLCGHENDCQLCSPAAYKGQCWCASVKFPDALLEQIPPEFRNKACLCRDCVTQFHQQAGKNAPARKLLPDDFYFDSSGLMVFTAAYHLRRGYCCDSRCRHCPFSPAPDAAPKV